MPIITPTTIIVIVAALCVAALCDVFRRKIRELSNTNTSLRLELEKESRENLRLRFDNEALRMEIDTYTRRQK